jgi:hypothetical protein
MVFFFFQNKKQKAFVLLHGHFILKTRLSQPRGLEACSRKLTNHINSILLFPEKEAKSVCSASQNKVLPWFENVGQSSSPKPPRSGPRGSGGVPPENRPIKSIIFFFFQKKKQKAFVLLRRM